MSRRKSLSPFRIRGEGVISLNTILRSRNLRYGGVIGLTHLPWTLKGSMDARSQLAQRSSAQHVLKLDTRVQKRRMAARGGIQASSQERYGLV